ncbi:MAG: hypothetical protein AAF085_02560 [Planctomycetota bacterium]
MRHAACCLILFATMLSLGGCDALGFMATAVAPPEQVEAKYDLPDKTTLVVIDDPRNLVTSPSTLRRIAASTRNVLEVEEVVVAGGFIGQDQLSGYREELGDRYNTTSLAALAMHLDANQVIHAEVTGFQMELGGNVIRPAIALNVKVFDLDERRRTFPAADSETGIDTGETSFALQSQMPAEDLTGATAARSIAVRDLADQTGRDIARLFFDWRMPPPGADIGKPR